MKSDLVLSEITINVWISLLEAFTGEKSPRASFRQLISDFEKMMDSEYYFARIRKFRAPASRLKNGDYLCFIEVSPDRQKAASAGIFHEASQVKLGNVQFLGPGQAANGIEQIVAIPKDEVQSLYGYLDEKVDIQIGIVEIDSQKLPGLREDKETLDSTILWSATWPIELSYYHLDEDRVSRKRFQTSLGTGASDAIIDLEYWKGSWRTNRD
jgi:hypothetical protein